MAPAANLPHVVQPSEEFRHWANCFQSVFLSAWQTGLNLPKNHINPTQKKKPPPAPPSWNKARIKPNSGTMVVDNPLIRHSFLGVVLGFHIFHDEMMLQPHMCYDSTTTIDYNPRRPTSTICLCREWILVTFLCLIEESLKIHITQTLLANDWKTHL